ncbi:MAG: methionyl-tRNA formyltransferase [Thermoanaerobaculia bacterium]
MVFFGSPGFALPTLEAIHDSPHHLLRVVSQPARPVGRGRRLEDPPVARWARDHGIEIEQAARVGDREFLARLARLEPSVAVVVAFGQIFPAELLELPRFGCINLHASLLPKYRGAAPIQAAVAAGDPSAGVTTMVMEEGLDSGPVLLQREAEIGREETAGELAERLAVLGAELMLETLDLLEIGRLEPQPQDAEQATYAPRLRKSDGRIEWSRPAEELFNRLRALTPWPGLFTGLRRRPVKVAWGRPIGDPPSGGEACGTYLGLYEGKLAVRCGGDSAFGIEKLQRPGRRVLNAREFANGERLEPGERFA